MTEPKPRRRMRNRRTMDPMRKAAGQRTGDGSTSRQPTPDVDAEWIEHCRLLLDEFSDRQRPDDVDPEGRWILSRLKEHSAP
jgi:hypothetical protein